VAMTGEITLRGRVLPIGGLKSKILAAHLSGARIVILPKKNEKDLRDIPDEILKQIHLVLAENMDQVLEAALRRRPEPLEAESAKSGGGKESEPESQVRVVLPPPPGVQPPAMAGRLPDPRHEPRPEQVPGLMVVPTDY
jgi:hypothetical protein